MLFKMAAGYLHTSYLMGSISTRDLLLVSWLLASLLADGLHSGEGLAAGQPASFLPDGLHSGEGLAAGQLAAVGPVHVHLHLLQPQHTALSSDMVKRLYEQVEGQSED